MVEATPAKIVAGRVPHTHEFPVVLDEPGQINVGFSHISLKTSEIPGFPVGGSLIDHGCGFH